MELWRYGKHLLVSSIVILKLCSSQISLFQNFISKKTKSNQYITAALTQKQALFLFFGYLLKDNDLMLYFWTKATEQTAYLTKLKYLKFPSLTVWLDV